MYYFFNKHKILRTIIDWIVLFVIGFSIMTLLSNVEMQTGWFAPVYINLFVICIFAYVELIHEPKENRMDLENWMNNIRWINGISLGLHTTVGFSKKASFDVIIPPIWDQSRSMIIFTLALYLFMIIVPTLVIEIGKRRR